MSSTALPASIEELMDTLKRELQADVEVEHISGDGAWPERFRLAITSPKFQGVRHLQRQDQIWEIVDRVIGREGAMVISLILAYAPGEVETDVPQS